MKYPRDLAVRIITQVLSNRVPLDDAMDAALGAGSPHAAMPTPSRAWLQDVCSGTLRWKGRIDYVIDSTALKKKPSGWLRKMLLVAGYQLIVQERTDPVSVVIETVDEVKKREGDAPAKFANAVLRKVSDHAKSWRELSYPTGRGGAKDLLGARAGWASLPEWMWTRLVDQHGEEWARAFALATLERPRIWILARDAAHAPTWAEPGPIARSFVATEGGKIPDRAGFAEGLFIVQDISSQTLVSRVAEAVRADLGHGARALDLCAAPGGKSVGLAWSGFAVTASDRDSPRMELLRQTVARAAPEVTIVGPTEARQAAKFDLVWVDAPCTGSGILRRHPDVRWLRQEKELLSLHHNQRELLDAGWAQARPGGYLAWSVCSVLKEEGPDLLVKAGLTPHVRQQWLLAPQDAPGGDGFWGALLRKP